MGESGEAQNITHQQKKMSTRSIAALPRPLPASRSPTTSSRKCRTSRSPKARRSSSTCARGGWSSAATCPRAARKAEAAADARRSPAFERFLKSTDEREISTTMAFVQILQMLLRDKTLGKHIVPIVPDESRTFGMEGMFRQLGIWNQQGQLYTPEDADQLMFYKESEGRADPAGRHQRGRRRCATGSPRRRRTRRTACR